MRLRSSSLVLVLALCPGLALAQTPPAASDAPPPPAATAPTPATPQAGSPPAPQAQPAAPAETPAQPQAPATARPAPAGSAQETARATLFPDPGDPANVDEGVLEAKPAAILPGTSTWAEALPNLKDAFARIEDELRKAGIAPTGRPLTVFVHTDDTGFRYEAMIPVARVPEGRSELTPEIRFGKTPAGKSFRFVHKDAYDEIDGTYETITAYLDAKDIVAQDVFMEEYVTGLTDAQDTGLEVNIYVQPKE